MGFSTPALTNRIKTYFTLYSGEEENGTVTKMMPMRKSDCSLEGTSEEITSDVKLPSTRIPSTPEKGSESCSGDVSTEWNIDEQDDWLAAVFCSSWENVIDETDESGDEVKKLTLKDEVSSFSLLKHYSQTPVEYQLFKKCYVNQLQIAMATDSFVKLTWSFMGSNNPIKTTSKPTEIASTLMSDPLTTKSYLTNSGFLKVRGTESRDEFIPIRQASNFSLTINNNLERTPALFEVESIENSLGDFNVEGSIDIYNADDIAREMYNSAVNGEDKILQVQLSRKVGSVTTSYTIELQVHLNAPTESTNGNKLQFSVPFKLNSENISIIKRVSGLTE